MLPTGGCDLVRAISAQFKPEVTTVMARLGERAMRKPIMLIIGAGMLATASANAAESVNTRSDSITLSNGKVYVLPEGVEAESVKVGQRVKVKFNQSKGKNRVSSLVKLK